MGIALAVEALGTMVRRDDDLGVRRVAAVSLLKLGEGARPACELLQAAVAGLELQHRQLAEDGASTANEVEKVLGLVQCVLRNAAQED